MDEHIDDSGPKPNYGFEGNPLGPWHNLDDERLKAAILTEAREYYDARKQTAAVDFTKFVDLFTAQWLEFKAKVEAEATSNGFRACVNLSGVRSQDRHKVAILALSINGSFILLGNGCLTSSGASGRYERIPFRISTKMGNRNAPHSVSCKSDPAVGSELSCKFLVTTSPLYLLYYTTDALPGANILRMGEHLSAVQMGVVTMIGDSLHDTAPNTPAKQPQRRENIPARVPVEV